MNRRLFISTLALASLATACGSRSTTGASGRRRVAITIDDPHTGETPLLGAPERDQAMLSTLASAGLGAALFVCGKRVDSPEGKQLLGRWNDAGHIICNHSWSHSYYHSEKVTAEAFIADAQRGELPIGSLPRFRRLFRYPYLKEGNTVEKRDRMRAWLHEQNYRNGHVSIDASDWYVDDRLRKRLTETPSADRTPYRDFYLGHIRERAGYYDGLSQALLGRSVPHVLLLHHSLLNALFLDDLLKMFRDDGWQLIDAEQAFEDPVYRSAPDILPAGESILWSLAKQSGRFEDRLRYPAEDGRYEEVEMNRLGL